MVRWRSRIQFSSGRCQPKKIPQLSLGVFSLVDPDRENWNCIFDEIERLSDKLEQLGIDALWEADDV